MATEVKVPVLGESVTEATVGEWLKQPGEAVAADEPIASLETDKVAIDVPSPVAGVMGEHKAAVGDTVEVDAVIALIEAGSGAAAKPAAAKEAAPAPAAAKEEPAASGDTVTMSPAVRRAVLEHGVDPTTIKGTGKDGRLTKEDVLAAAKAKETAPAAAQATAPSPAPVAATAAPGRNTERVKMTRMRQTIAKRLKGAQENAALLTTFNDVDMSAVIEARNKYKDLFAKKHDVRLGFMGFFAKAACLALKDVPSVNAYIEGDEIVYHDYVDISVAVSAPNGLVVPVVRDADSKGFAEIEAEISGLGKRAREGKLTIEDMTGGTFTITNGGIYGSMLSTPILNTPQSGILGMHNIKNRAVVLDDGSIVSRPIMYLALSYDHRIVDGREAVTFLVRVKECIEDPSRLLIDT